MNACSAHFCHLNHFCHSSPVLSIHINRFCQPHYFCQLLSTQSSPLLSAISTTYVATDEVTQTQTKTYLFDIRIVQYSESATIIKKTNNRKKHVGRLPLKHCYVASMGATNWHQVGYLKILKCKSMYSKLLIYWLQHKQ